MIRLENLFEKKILYVGLIGFPIVILLLLSKNFSYYNSYGELKSYTDYVNNLCGIIGFIFFMKDSKFTFKYWIFMIIITRILSILSIIFLQVFITNIQFYIIFSYIIIELIIFPIMYKTFKEYSYQNYIKKYGEFSDLLK